MLRLFVGLELPSPVQSVLAKRCLGLKNCRWVEPHNMHITLAFIGETDEGTAQDFHNALDLISFSPFELSLKDVGSFESRGKIHSIWAGVDGDLEALESLHHKILIAAESVGLEPERRKYKPHVTLVRMREEPSHRIQDYLAMQSDLQTDAFTVERFSLFQSHLTRHGPDYQVLERYGDISLGSSDIS